MDCSQLKELLSAYYDDELLSDKRTAVAEHLAGCHDCAGELQEFGLLSAMTEGLAQPEPPAHLWEQIAQQMDVEARDVSPRTTRPGWRGWTRRPAVRVGLAAAAAILIVVGWFGYDAWVDRGHQDFEAVFGQYLEQLRHDPTGAQQILLARYEGQAVDAGQAVTAAGYRPVVADGMPAGYSVEATYVMKMPCCTCVQCFCKRSDGSIIAVFEHDDEDPGWFGGRPVRQAVCGGKPCRIVDLDQRLAATWRRGDRHVTVVGVRDTTEVDRLVAWFDERRPLASP